MSRFNVNTNHPLIPNSQEYTFYQKFVAIHSVDRDINKFPNASEFEIELPQDFLNVVGVSLKSWSFPQTDVFSSKNNNLTLSFIISEPYNAMLNNNTNELQIEISNGLYSHINESFIITIEEGVYRSEQMATELTNKMNEVVTKFIEDYLTSINSSNLSTFTSSGGYSEFVVAFNQVSKDLWFGNSSSNFIINNTNTSLYTQNVMNVITQCSNYSLPEFSYWGLPAYLGFSKLDEKASSLPNNDLPRFYYEDYVSGDNGYWLPSNSSLSGSNVYFLKTPYKININGPSFYYVDIKELNCIDETSPYNLSTFTLTTNSTNGRVNSAFARVSIGTNQTPTTQWYNDITPYKLFVPPAERIRRLHICIRNHNGQLVTFNNYEFSFMLEFTLYSSQIGRKYNLYKPNINSR